MRIQSLLLCLPVVLLPPTAIQKPAEKGAAQEQAGAVPMQILAQIELVAKQLAKGGRERETKDLLAVLEKLGYPKANHERLEKTCKDDLAKAKVALDALPAGAKQLRVTARQIVAIMNKLEDGDAKSALACNILVLDGECEEAHKALGREKVGKSWVPTELVEARQRRGEILQKVEEAKKLEVDVERGEVDDTYIQKACGVKATLVRRGQYELRSNFSVEKTERMLRETERARALGYWLRRGEFKLPVNPKGGVVTNVWVLIDSREQFNKLAAELAASGQLTTEDAKMMEKPNTQLGSFNVKGGPRVVLAQFETHVQAQLLVSMSSLREGVHTPLSAGHLNWLALACFGCTLPNFFFKEEKARRFGETTVKSAEDEREREELLRLAKAGIAGSRTWMQYLAERGEDPPFANSFVEALGAITGNDLHKCTSIVEFLQETSVFGSILKKLRSDRSVKTAGLYSEAMDMSVGDLESKWRTWLLGSRPGVAERVDKENLNAWPRDALSVLEYMNKIRESTFKDKIEGVWKLKFDPDLSEECALHAHYLTLHPEQQKWPDAHEEYADKEGYTVEGAWAGTHSVIVWKEGGLESWQEAVDVWLASFYHRLPLTDPGVLRLGWGSEEIYAVMDMSSLAAPYDKPFTVMFPYDGQTDVPEGFLGNEHPDPVPEGAPGSVNEVGKFGYPVTIQTNPVDEAGGVVDIEMKLFEGKDGKVQVDCHFSTPLKPTNPEVVPAGAWCLIPKSPLKQKTEYKVVADILSHGGSRTGVGKHREWTFKTR